MNIEYKNPEITNATTDNSVDKTEILKNGTESCNEHIDKVDIGSIALKGAEVTIESEKIIRKDRNRLGYSLIGCCEACKIKDLLSTQEEYISVDDVSDFVGTYNHDGVGRLFGLLQFKDNITNRINSNEKVEVDKRLKRENLREMKHLVNSGYVVSANKKIYKYMHNPKDTDKNSFKFFREYLAAQIDIASRKSKDINNELSSFDLNKENYDTTVFFDVANGMRHEAAFQELLKEMPDLIDFRQSTNLEDSKGVDLIIKAKISNSMDDSGYYKYATSDEITSDNYKILELPVDIKSTKKRADEALTKSLNNGYEINHWTIWSNVYPEDFLLDIDDKNRVRLHKGKDKAVLLLNKDKQIAAMKRLGEIQYERRDGQMLRPASLEKRMQRIKDEILNGLNRMYGDNNR